jgi:hypothetical protein
MKKQQLLLIPALILGCEMTAVAAIAIKGFMLSGAATAVISHPSMSAGMSSSCCFFIKLILLFFE